MFAHTGYKLPHYLFIVICACALFAWNINVFTQEEFVNSWWFLPFPKIVCYVIALLAGLLFAGYFLYAMLYWFRRREKTEVIQPLRDCEAAHFVIFSWCIIYAFFASFMLLFVVLTKAGMEPETMVWLLILISAPCSFVAIFAFRRIFQPTPYAIQQLNPKT